MLGAGMSQIEIWLLDCGCQILVAIALMRSSLPVSPRFVYGADSLAEWALRIDRLLFVSSWMPFGIPEFLEYPGMT